MRLAGPVARNGAKKNVHILFAGSSEHLGIEWSAKLQRML
jgi:hypothetical protein